MSNFLDPLRRLFTPKANYIPPPIPNTNIDPIPHNPTLPELGSLSLLKSSPPHPEHHHPPHSPVRHYDADDHLPPTSKLDAVMNYVGSTRLHRSISTPLPEFKSNSNANRSSVGSTLNHSHQPLESCIETPNTPPHNTNANSNNSSKITSFSVTKKIPSRRRTFSLDKDYAYNQAPYRQRPKLLQGYNLSLSTEENHRAPLKVDDKMNFTKEFEDVRMVLDYTYHHNYTLKRQALQDTIIRRLLDLSQIVDINGETCTTPTKPWIVFTAGSMGSGKSYTIRKLMESGYFPLLAFVGVDPDNIRRYLPEFEAYVEYIRDEAGEMTRKEAGFLVELLTEQALKEGKNVLVDGSLRDWVWYEKYFERLKVNYPELRIAILHVTSPEVDVFTRAGRRGIETGRVIPERILKEAVEQVPVSVRILKHKVDFFCELSNSSEDEDIKIVTPQGFSAEDIGSVLYGLGEVGIGRDEAFSSFMDNWKQVCKFTPAQSRRRLEDMSEGESESKNDSGGVGFEESDEDGVGDGGEMEEFE